MTKEDITRLWANTEDPSELARAVQQLVREECAVICGEIDRKYEDEDVLVTGAPMPYEQEGMVIDEPEALKLAKQLGQMDCLNTYENKILDEAARELCRLHRVNQELVEALEKIGGLSMSQFFNPSDMACECVEIARVAIVKSKGESNE